MDPEVWFPTAGAPTRTAKKICRKCPVREECLQYALDNKEAYGVWGGHDVRERKKMQKALREVS